MFKLFSFIKSIFVKAPVAPVVPSLETKHLNEKGTPRRGFNTLETAEHSAASLAEKTGDKYTAYKCDECDKFHIDRA